MILIPGILISIATFPGVIVHEAAHMLFCKIRKVPVFEVRFFQFDSEVSGYVHHGETKDFTSSFLISTGPFFLNSLLCIIICFPASLPHHLFGESNFISLFLLWLGVSMGMNAFPSPQDANNLWVQAKKETRKMNLLAIVSFPLVVIIHIANLLKMVWFDAIYGAFLGIFLPGILFSKLL